MSPADVLDEGVSAEGAWLELSVTADNEAVEAVSEILSRFAPGGTTVEPAFELVDEGLGARVDVDRPAVVRAYLPARDRSAALGAVDGARAALGHLQAFGLRPIGELQTRVVHEEDWAHAWKAHFPVLRIGRRLVVRPTWRRHRRTPDDVVIALDPGMAFGTGLHPTTRLCLAGIEAWADDGRFATGTARHGGSRVLDVGCGSGILAIAAVKRWPGTTCVAIDNDPIAVTATQANAEVNHVADRIQASTRPIEPGGPTYPLVLANIQAHVLRELRAPLIASLAPGGTLILSGLLTPQAQPLADEFVAAGLACVHVRASTADPQWSCAVLVR